MKLWIVGIAITALLAAGLPSVSEAKRFGGGKPSGMQRDMPARTAPDTPPARPAQPAPSQSPNTAGAAAPAAAGAAAAATAKRSWMGPIAGLAAGLGLVALASALGFGEELASFLMLALLAVAVLAIIGFVMRRRAAQAVPAGAARSPLAAGGAQVSWPSQAGASSAEPQAAPLATPRAASGVTDPVPGLAPAGESVAEPAVAERAAPKAFVPAAFDAEGFARTAKMIFIRMQAANDAADLDDLRRFTTPEFFASIRLDLQERGAADNHTDVRRVDAEVLDVTNEDTQQIVSVRFRGEIVEERGAEPQAFDEVWHLVKPHDDSRPWAIAGIEQMA